MKKKFLLMAFVFLISGIIFMADVDAALGQYLVTRISHQQYQLYGTTTSLPVWLNLYQATVDGIPADTYCVDPGLSYGGGGAYYLNRYIDPTTNNALDLAIAGALNEMENIRNEVGGGDAFHLIGTVAMRWVFMAYGGSRDAGTPQLHRDYMAFKNSDTAISVSGNTAIIAYARQVFVNAINAVLSGSYDNAVAQGFIWGPKFTTVEYTETTVNSTTKRVTFIIQSEDEALTPDKFTEYIDGFTAACSNTTVTCTVNSKTARAEPAGILIDMNIDITNWDGQDFGIIVNPAYCDSRDAGMQVLLLQRSNSVQRMLVVMPGSCPATPTDTTRHPTRPPIRITSGPRNDESCVCDTTTGIYTYQKYENGNLVAQDSWSESSSNYQEMMDKYANVGCPGTCTAQKHVCEIIGDQHYCNDGEPCSEQEYRVDCLGEVNCTPTVSLTSDCQDLESGENDRLDGQYDAIVSDINQINTTCNPDTNQIKACVLGKEDLTNQSFESTEYELGEDNPYCSVWCNETYQFNLPTARYSTSGGYFTLSMSIKGQRDCYISSADDPSQPINTQKFNEDVANAQEAVRVAWNEYSYWKYAVLTNGNEVHHTDSHSSGSSSCCDPDDDGGCSDDGCSGETIYDDYYTYSWSYLYYNNVNSGPTWRSDGSHQSGTAGSCPSSCCSGSCTPGERGTPQMSYFQQMEASTKQTLMNRINELNTIIRQYNNCTGAITNSEYMNFIGNLTSNTANSTGWNNKMNFDPTVEFKYYESYLHDIQGEFVMNDSSAKLDVLDEEYFTGEVGDTYGDNQDSNQGTNSMTSVLGTRNIFVCNEGGCQNIPVTLSNATWIRKTKTNSADFEPNVNFSTYTPYGTIKVQEGPNNDYLWTNLPDDAFPVALIRETGVFPFKFTFYGIGQSNTNGSLGRLIDGNSSNTVLVQLSKVEEGLKCNDGDVESPSVDGGYVCHYLNNCPGCDFTCDDDNNCEFDDCDGGYCTLECPNCVFDGENANFSYRTVSLNNMFPNDREIGYNWSQTVKAEATLQEIEDAGESIYEEPQYSYTLSPTNLRNIREYNDDAGSYTNSHTPESVNGDDVAVYCDTVVVEGKEYSVRCKSRFLDLIDSSGNEYATNVIRPDPNDNNSWTLFTDTQYYRTNCPTNDCLSKSNIGPAWK